MEQLSKAGTSIHAPNGKVQDRLNLLKISGPFWRDCGGQDLRALVSRTDLRCSAI